MTLVHSRFEVAVGSVLMNSAAVHVVIPAHVLSLVLSGAPVWYSVVVQPVIAAQVRSLVTPGAAAWY